MPRSFSKGKRGIAGTLVFVVFDRDALLETLRANLKDSGIKNLYTAKGNVSGTYGFGGNLDKDWNASFGNVKENRDDLVNDLYVSMNQREYANQMKYLDQFPPFDITITMANEFGQNSSMKIHGVQILNEGSGMSIDDMVIEKACTFVAKDITPLGENDMTETSGKSSILGVADRLFSR